MNNPPMNDPMNNAPLPVGSTPPQKKKRPTKPKAANGAATAVAAKRGRKKKVGDDKKNNKKKFGKKGVTVTSQAREIVYNVIKHFKKEAQQKCNSHPFENWLKRSVAATGLSKSTLQRIIKEVEKPPPKPVPEQMNQVPPKEHLNPPPHQPQHAEILVSQTLEAVKLEQYEQGLIKHFTSNFMHHNLHHHHPMTPHHPELLLQPIHHAPMPPPPQPPPPPPIHPHPHNPHTHIHL